VKCTIKEIPTKTVIYAQGNFLARTCYTRDGNRGMVPVSRLKDSVNEIQFGLPNWKEIIYLPPNTEGIVFGKASFD